MIRRLSLILVLLARPLWGQGVGFEVGRFMGGPDRTTFRAGLDQSLFGPIGSSFYASLLHAPQPAGNLWGAGADLSLFRGGRGGPYLIGGIAAGLAPGTDHDGWYSWSAGLGYEVFPFSPVSLSAEGRWRMLQPGRYDGLELSVRLGFHGRRDVPIPRSYSGVPEPTLPSESAVRGSAETGLSAAGADLAAKVISTASEVMGTPYRWGGSSEDGFDCSGLIRYAYGKHGIELPRRSAEQALEGAAVSRSVDSLVPGDILTFSNARRRITHVGLYVGEGKFIHSASKGVHLSVLSPDDPYGRWWYQRWVGARRIIK